MSPHFGCWHRSTSWFRSRTDLQAVWKDGKGPITYAAPAFAAAVTIVCNGLFASMFNCGSAGRYTRYSDRSMRMQPHRPCHRRIGSKSGQLTFSTCASVILITYRYRERQQYATRHQVKKSRCFSRSSGALVTVWLRCARMALIAASSSAMRMASTMSRWPSRI